MQFFFRKIAGFVSVVALSLIPLSVLAAGERAFDAREFQAAQDAGKPVLIAIHAVWCPTCKVQQPILDKLSKEPAYSSILRLRVDFDTQKDLLKQFNARVQSTLVLYKGRTEIARSTGETDESRIRAMLDKAL